MLIEIGARLPGDHIVDLVELVTGVSLPQVMLAVYAGLDLAATAPTAVPRAKTAGIGFFTAAGLAVPEVGALADVHDASDVIAITLYQAAGEALEPPEDFRSRFGHVLFTADSAAAARQRWDQLRAEVGVG